MSKKLLAGLSKGIEVGADGLISFLERIYGARYFEMTEQAADPPAPGAGRVRIYPRDDGAGNTQLCARFSTGEVVVLAIEGGGLEVDMDRDGEPAAVLDQGDDDGAFINLVGTTAADQSKSISTADGDGAMTGPHNVNLQAGWEFEGMVRAEINGVMKWVAYYIESE